MVHNGEDGVFSIPRGKSRDQVHCYLLEWSSVLRDRDSIEWGFLLVHNDLVLLAGSASLDVSHNPVIHSRPLVDFFHFSDCFVLSRMSHCHMIMSMRHNEL